MLPKSDAMLTVKHLVNRTVFSCSTLDKRSVLLSESIKTTVLDTASGVNRINCYVDSTGEDQKQPIKHVFKIGTHKHI